MLLRISIWTFGYSGFFFDMFLADLSNHAMPQTHSLVLFNLLTPCRDAKWWSTQFVFMHSALPDEAILHCVCVFVQWWRTRWAHEITACTASLQLTKTKWNDTALWSNTCFVISSGYFYCQIIHNFLAYHIINYFFTLYLIISTSEG